MLLIIDVFLLPDIHIISLPDSEEILYFLQMHALMETPVNESMIAIILHVDLH